MDEVTYAAGRPNVLTMTKIVPVDARAASEATVPAESSERQARGTFRRIDRDGETVLACAGVLDVVTVCDLRPLVEAVVAERRRSIVLDAGALRMIDSTGVGSIVGLVKRVRSFGGVVRVSGLRDQPLEVFRLLRLDLIFELPGGAPPHGSS
jgi:anti-sigma B factor antagonist